MAYPVTNPNVLLGNGVLVSTTVNIVGVQQVATVIFSTAAGPMGTVVLSPMQPQYANLNMAAGLQTVAISLIAFVPAFGITQGSVTCSGTATDALGKNPVAFSIPICSWT